MAAGERVVCQWLLSPAQPTKVPKRAPRPASRSTELKLAELALNQSGLVEASDVRDLKAKQAGRQLLYGVGRIEASSASHRRSLRLLQGVAVALHGVDAPGVRLKRSVLPSSLVARRLRSRSVPLVWPAVLNPAEVSRLVAWPVDSMQSVGWCLVALRNFHHHDCFRRLALSLARRHIRGLTDWCGLACRIPYATGT